MEDAASFEGQVVDGQFPLKRYLGGGVHSAVFLTSYEGGHATIKFVPYRAEQLADWEAAGQLKHPDLLRIFAGGEHRLGQTDCAYVVTEYADDNLAPLLAERHLTPAEAREMSLAVAGALAYLHARGWAHGHVKASNIMGIGDRIALSSDCVSRDSGGGAAADCLALGTLLRQAIPSLPAPFLEIVQHAAAPDPLSRWTAAMVENHLRGGTPPLQPPPAAPRALWQAPAVVAAVLVVLLAAAVAAFWLTRGSSPPSPPASKPAAVETKQGGADSVRKDGGVKDTAEPAGVVKQVLPEIPQIARDTITGSVRINVRATVDSTGTVAGVVLEPPKASPYFSERVLDAARQWQFQPAPASRDWTLHFQLFRDDTKVSATRAE